jgi:hypothetical protein
MLSNSHLWEELKKIDATIKNEKDSFKSCVLKIGDLMLKLMHNIRTNQVEMMKKMGIELLKSNRDDNQGYDDTPKNY